MKTVLVEKDIAPYGVKCLLCNRIARVNQFVLLHTIENVKHIVFHKRCLTDELELMPDGLYGTN